VRKSSLYLAALALLLLATALICLHGALGQGAVRRQFDRHRRLVSRLGLTDLCLVTEARYTRHPTQADLFSAFQDHPLSLEHFPSGAILSPPRYGRQPAFGRGFSRPARAP